MSSIATVGSAGYQSLLANMQRLALGASGNSNGNGTSAKTEDDGSQSPASTLTLSAAARAALAGTPFETVIDNARSKFDVALSKAKATSPLDEDGALVIDLSGLDRRELWAVASNAANGFSSEERQAAALEMTSQFDVAMAGPTAVARATGAIKGLYVAALAWLDGASAEEKQSSSYAAQRSALLSGLDQLAKDPTKLPPDSPDDLVIGYMDRLASGQTATQRDIGAVATDARAALDAQIAAARAAGQSLVFDSYGSAGVRADFSGFDTRSLSAIALDTGKQFSPAQSRAARTELRLRQGAEVLASLKQAAGSGDAGGFASNLIALYGGMSTEERSAAGWSPDFYKSAVASYQTSVKIGSMLSGGTSPLLAALTGGTSESDENSGSMSLMDYL
jgi:hypothetical protein